MGSKLIDAMLHQVIRKQFGSKDSMMDAIALYVCRENDEFIRKNYTVSEFDYETLFREGEKDLVRMKKQFADPNLLLLKHDMKSVAETLLEISQEKSMDQAYVRKDVSDCLFWCLDPSEGQLVYNPFAGDYWAPRNNPKVYFRTEGYSTSTRFHQLLCVAEKRDNVKFVERNPSDSIFSDKIHQTYRYIYVPGMPVESKTVQWGRKGDEMRMLRLLDRLDDTGRMVCVLPASALSSDTFFEFRKEILFRKYLKTVILFAPEVVFSNTRINLVAFVLDKLNTAKETFTFVNTENLIFKSGPADLQKLFNAISRPDGSTAREISFASVYKADALQIRTVDISSIRIERPGYRFVKLRDILVGFNNNVNLEGTEMVPRLSGKDMHLVLPDYSIGVQDVSLDRITGRANCIDQPIFCFHGITQEFVWYEGDKDFPTYCNSDVYTFLIKDSLISPEYLCFILREPDVAEDIKSRVSGNVIPRITKKSLLDVEIPIPSRDHQLLEIQEMQQYVSDQKSILSKEFLVEHEAEISSIKEDIEDKIHLLGPYNTNVQSGINRIIKLLGRGVTIGKDSVIYSQSGITAERFFKTLLQQSKAAGYILSSIDESIFEPVSEPLEGRIFVEEYKNYLESDPEFATIQIGIDLPKDDCLLMIDRKALYLTLDTIVRNACDHGFTDGFEGVKRIRISLKVDRRSKMAVISVANNGLPVSKGFSQDLYERKFGKCGSTANTGRGGFFVHNAVEYYHGKLTVDTADKQWPFIVNLYIPISHD